MSASIWRRGSQASRIMRPRYPGSGRPPSAICATANSTSASSSCAGSARPSDFKSGYVWLALAARDGDTESAAKRDQVGRYLTDAELDEAKAMIANFKPLEIDRGANEVELKDIKWDRVAPAARRGRRGEDEEALTDPGLAQGCRPSSWAPLVRAHPRLPATRQESRGGDPGRK